MAFANNLWGSDSVGFDKNFLPVHEVMEQSGLNFRVESEPVFLGDGTKVDKCNATVRQDTREILGTVGDRYTVLQNEESFSWFDPFIESKHAYIDAVGTLKRGQITFIQAKIVSTDPVEITKGDIIEPYVTLLNSHSGITSVFGGFFNRRIFCQNQLPALKSSKMLRVKHTKNVQIAMNKVQEIMNISTQEFLATTQQYKFLASKSVNKSDLEKYIKLVFKKDNDEETEMRESRVEEIMCLYETGRGAKETPDSLWKGFNAVNEYLNYNSGREVGNRLQSLWVGQNAILNQKALDVAIEFAK